MSTKRRNFFLQFFWLIIYKTLTRKIDADDKNYLKKRFSSFRPFYRSLKLKISIFPVSVLSASNKKIVFV